MSKKAQRKKWALQNVIMKRWLGDIETMHNLLVKISSKSSHTQQHRGDNYVQNNDNKDRQSA